MRPRTQRVPWSIPLGRWWGVGLRVHVILPMWAIAEVIGGVSERNLGTVHAAAMAVAFIGVVLYRELGRIAAARALSADAGGISDIELWPLGGLSMSGPGRRVGCGVLSESGGVLAGAVALPLLAACVVLSGAGWDALRFNPLQPGVTAGALRTLWQVGAWWAYYACSTVLLANLLLPMAGFDLGRVLERRLGAELAGRIGVVVGLGLFVAAAGAGLSRLVAAGMIGVVASWVQLQRGLQPARDRRLFDLAEAEPAWAPTEAAAHDFESVEHDPGVVESDEESPLDGGAPPVTCSEPPLEPAPGRASVAIEPEPTLDEVLALISARGIDALGQTEWRVLQRETLLRRLADQVSPKDNDVVAAE
ncbi:MAG: hypothetical protein GC200_02625 [Tepidisphaera sp.]|nr:hypothetical protein [Tepidisphaera sp.]